VLKHGQGNAPVNSRRRGNRSFRKDSQENRIDHTASDKEQSETPKSGRSASDTDLQETALNEYDREEDQRGSEEQITQSTTKKPKFAGGLIGKSPSGSRYQAGVRITFTPMTGGHLLEPSGRLRRGNAGSPEETVKTIP